MCKIMINYQRNVTLIIFFTLANLLTSIRPQRPIRPQPACPNYGNFPNSSSTYQSNLNTLLSVLSTNIDNNGFYSSSVGQNSYRVNAYALCRGDIQLNSCRICVRSATSDLVRSCINYTRGNIWTESCTLRYSNVHMSMSTDPYYWWNRNNVENPRSFVNDLVTLLQNLSDQASNGDSLQKVAASTRRSSANQVIYGLVQCTPDLSREECSSCLNDSITEITRRFPPNSVPQGARINTPSCNIRYEIYSFYNQTRLQEFEPSPPPEFEPSPPGNDDNRPTRTIISIVVALVGSLAIIVFIGCFIIKMKRKPKKSNEVASLLEGSVAEEISIFESLQYDFGIFKAATNDFSEANKLGEGGFGAVYKGTLPNGKEIAVKRLSIGSSQGDLEFKNEVMLLVKLQHRNLVKLLGYSREGSEKLLVYEFMQNASLDAFIFDTTKRSLLDWDKRNKIIWGIARGILYLHEDSRLTIIHRDLKAGNVLLDGNLNPKIADFGMARLFVPEDIQGSTNRIVGTYGYMAPEYVMHGEFSVKSDVFSFGVLLLEIICGQKNNSFRHGGTKRDLISSAWKNWRQGTVENLVDPFLNVGSSVPRDIMRCIHMGLLCVQENAVDRPTMASVITMLNNFSIPLPIPSLPAFFVYNRSDSDSLPLQEFSWGEENSNGPRNNNNAELLSQNEMSISEFQAR